jgi:hypothetical protein
MTQILRKSGQKSFIGLDLVTSSPFFFTFDRQKFLFFNSASLHSAKGPFLLLMDDDRSGFVGSNDDSDGDGDGVGDDETAEITNSEPNID